LNSSTGHGGHGCIAFHREKFKAFGPPAGGNGGPGGSVYIVPSTRVTSLSHLQRVIKAKNGGTGQGTWRHGKRGEDITIEVPYGTVLRGVRLSGPHEELERDRETRWKRRWVHTSGYEDANEERDAYLDANRLLDSEEGMRWQYWQNLKNTELVLDFPEPLESTNAAPKATKLVAGGEGGLGNPGFLAVNHRSPKFASRGLPGASMRLYLQLKLLADIGLVGLPNAGKSSLVRALTGLGTEVGNWAFTTLNPSIGVVRVWPGGAYGASPDSPVEETKEEVIRRDDAIKHGLDPVSFGLDSVQLDLKEEFRFTIADNPGLIEDASQNVGLGHSFLKSIERSKALVYVVDLSAEESNTTTIEASPEQALLILRRELELYKEGLSKMARLVIANKADLLVPSRDNSSSIPSADIMEAEVRAMKRLAKLEAFAQKEFGIDVIPVSAKWGMNLEIVVGRMRGYVEEARKREAGNRVSEEFVIEQELTEPLRIE